MEHETKCGAQETKSEIYETKAIPYESNSIAQQYAPGQTLILKEETEENSLTVKEETGENSLTVKEETGENWVCHATDLMKASPSTDHSGDSLSRHDNLPSDEEKVFKSPHSVDEKPAIEWSTGGSHVPKRCMECDKVFAFNFQLQRHVAVVHRARREHKCEECGREFASLSGLNSHRQVNHRNHLYMCPYENCDHPGYKSVQAFKSHIRSVHTKARPYVCKTCGKAFHNGNRLRIHNFTHTSEGAFHCKCGIKFRQKCTLNKHQRLCILD